MGISESDKSACVIMRSGLEGIMAVLSWPIITLPSISLVLIIFYTRVFLLMIFFLSICLKNDINIKQEVEKISRYEPNNSSFLRNYIK